MKFLQILTLMFITQTAQANPYKYEVRKTSSHVIHIVTLNPQDYEIEFVKAHNRVFGRETVGHIAERENADIAINAGFFEIGGSQDGMPSMSLVLNGRIFGLCDVVQSQLILSSGKLSMTSHAFDISANSGGHKIHINKYNGFADKNDVVLYSDALGDTTLTDYKNRDEVTFDQNYKFIKLYDHGNAVIPENGSILSLPKSLGFNGATIQLVNRDTLLKGNTISVVSGKPMLIDKEVIEANIFEHNSGFYQKPHARTALGLRQNGEVVIVVAEHCYTRDLGDVTTDDVKRIIQNNKLALETKYKKPPNQLTFDEIKEIVSEEYTKTGAAIGLTIPELANFMLELGCTSAINLDGGGSSTLWIDGKVVNKTIGDEDEGNGAERERPVSDAVIFRKK